MSTIRPMKCPWCGTAPRLHQWHFGAVIYCPKCKARGPETGDLGSNNKNATEAWRLWNRRTELDVAVGALLDEWDQVPNDLKGDLLKLRAKIEALEKAIK